MLLLPSNCRCSEPSVFPKDWRTNRRPISWRIQYYFYEPDKKGKLIVIKGMNIYKAHAEKKAATAALLSNEIEMLKNGYNPVAGKFIHQKESEVSADTLLFDALKFAASKFTGKSKSDYKSILLHCQKAANGLGLHTLVIGNVKRRHVRIILDAVGEAKGSKWTANNFNYYRAHLSVLFNELLQYDVLEFNPVIGIKKAKVVRVIKEVLTRQQRAELDKRLRMIGENRFRLFLRIFFHSGIRLSEIMLLKAGQVDIRKQTIRVTIKKDRQPAEVDKPVKSIAVRYWKMAIKGVPDDYYVFSRNLLAGPSPVAADTVTRRWRRVVKPLGITADLYALKHANTTEMVDVTGSAVAALLNSHKSTAMVQQVYDVKRDRRIEDAVRAAVNEY
jgi:integrase